MYKTNHKNPPRKNIVEAFYNRISKPFSTIIIKTTLTPNQITLISGLFGVAGAFLLTSKNYTYLVLAALFIQLFTILDLVDGDVARAKKMQSLFGKWFDVLFDKLNDMLIILGLSIGQYWRTNDITALYLGMILMGFVFFIQNSMLSNYRLFNKLENSGVIGNNSNIKIGKGKIISKKSLINTARIFIGKHFLLEHSTFLFLVSLFVLFDEIEFGIWFLVFHALLTILYITITSALKLSISLKGKS